MAQGSTGVVYASLAGDILVTASKFGAAAASGSTAMLTEAIHSLADSADQVLLLIGERRGRKAADASHPFGYGLEVYFWTFMVAVMVFVLGGALSAYEGVRHILSPTRSYSRSGASPCWRCRWCSKGLPCA
jgi:divalent metal cation (Fe/Co/Zn/Cd) transporter